MIRRKIARHWVLGSTVAFFGVGLVRLAAPYFDVQLSAYVKVAGFVLAVFGLFIIARGTGKRVRTKD